MTGLDLKTKAINTGRSIMYRAKDISGKVIALGKNGINWAMQNPEKAAAAMAASATVIGGANRLVRGINRNITAQRELYDKHHRIYDHSLRCFIYTKKPLDKKTIEQIYDIRRRTGKKVGEIVCEMGLLK